MKSSTNPKSSPTSYKITSMNKEEEEQQQRLSRENLMVLQMQQKSMMQKFEKGSEPLSSS